MNDRLVYTTMLEVLERALAKQQKRLASDERLLAHVLDRVEKSHTEFIHTLSTIEQTQRELARCIDCGEKS